MNQTSLWLAPLILGTLVGIVNALRIGWRWSWGTILQLLIVGLIGSIGLMVEKYDYIFAIVGWSFLLSFTVFARIILMRMTASLGLLRTTQALRTAGILKILLWGPPGSFWFDLIRMVDSFAQGNAISGSEIYQKWNSRNIPKAIRGSLDGYAMLGLLVNRDWHGVITKYESVKAANAEDIEREKAKHPKKAPKTRFPAQIAVPACRAYCEVGNSQKALEALQYADLSSSGYSRDSLETIFLSFFAMIGDRDDLQALVTSMKGRNTTLPEFGQLYWQGRCEVNRGDFVKAAEYFEKSLERTPKNDNTWRERTVKFLNYTRNRIAPGGDPDSPVDSIYAPAAQLTEEERQHCASVAKQIMARCLSVAGIMAGKKNAPAVNALVIIICAIFSVTYLPRFSTDESMHDIYVYTYAYGVLLGEQVYQGDFWRLITYQFLHGGLSHLVMNVLGLVWFGRYVENIYGAGRFLLIFIGAGTLSGIAQMVLTPDLPAVGASGAVLGIFGAGAAATIRLKNVLPPAVRNSELTWMGIMAITQILFDQFVNSLFPSASGSTDAVRIAAYAHIGGMLSGFVLGWVLPMRRSIEAAPGDVK